MSHDEFSLLHFVVCLGSPSRALVVEASGVEGDACNCGTQPIAGRCVAG